MAYPRKSRLDLAVSYEKKTAELRSRVEEQAKILQNTVEAKDNALREVQSLGERKSELRKELASIENQIAEARLNLHNEIQARTKYIESAKVELEKEKVALAEVGKEVIAERDKLAELKRITEELSKFISSASQAREDYLGAKGKLDEAVRTEKEIMFKVSKEKAEMSQEKQDLDNFKTYVINFYGRLGTYHQLVRQITEHLHQLLKENKVPMQFGLPPDRITKVPFEEFEKFYNI
jgi:chromosome segregation ATPase